MEGKVCIYTAGADGKPESPAFIDVTDIDKLVEVAGDRAMLGNVFCSVDLIDPDAVAEIQRKRGRGKESQIGAMVSLRADVDATKPGSTEKGHNYPTREHILHTLAAMPLLPTMIVGSGSRGVHPYWCFHEPVVIDSEEKRRWLKGLSKGWQRLLKSKLGSDPEGKLYDLDSTADLTRVLRPAGTFNYKHGRLVEILDVELGRRYSPDDFEQFLFHELPKADGNKKTRLVTPPGIEEETIIEQASWRLSQLSGAVSGQGGHNHTFHATAVLVLGYGLSVEAAYPLLEAWNKKCQPPWMEEELRHKLESVDQKAGPRGYLVMRDKDKDRLIVLSTNEKQVVDQAIEALAEQQNIFQRGGLLVHVVRDAKPPKGVARPKDAPRIVPVKQARLRELLATAATWARKNNDGELDPCHPPDWAVRAVDAREEWPGIPRLEGIVEAPVVRADGTILQTPGYDPLTGLIYEPQIEFPAIPEKLTKAHAEHARDALLEVVEDFPFESDSHRATWVASTITPLARFAYHGPAPLFAIDANVRGCGKTLLTDTTAVIVSGRDMARMTAPRDDDETRKRITAIAIAAEPLVLIDNVSGTLGTPSLDAALTATTWTDRVLGESKMASQLPMTTTWYATGNNIILVGDTVRRVAHIRLESPEENPEERSGFHHPYLLALGTTATFTSCRGGCHDPGGLLCGRAPEHAAKALGLIRGLV